MTKDERNLIFSSLIVLFNQQQAMFSFMTGICKTWVPFLTRLGLDQHVEALVKGIIEYDRFEKVCDNWVELLRNHDDE